MLKDIKMMNNLRRCLPPPCPPLPVHYCNLQWQVRHPFQAFQTCHLSFWLHGVST